MRTSSTYKILHLLNLLLNDDCTKNDIVKDFQSIGININKPTINKYIERLRNNKLEIQTLKEKNENLYHLKKEEADFSITPKEMSVIKDIKKLLIAQKQYNRIRKTMRMFYKFAKYIKDEETREEFIDFGYYSTINWHLVRQLENHCKTKDVIQIDYMLPQGENRHITIHVDNLKIGDWSERLYLHGMFENAQQFSHLPVDRIFMVKKTLRQNVRFNFPTDIVEYRISNEIFKETGLDSKEILIHQDNDYVSIQRPIEDNFYLTQRLLYFCPDLYYISDENIKNSVKEKLDLIKSYYDNRIDQ